MTLSRVHVDVLLASAGARTIEIEYIVEWRDEHGTWQYPGSETDATFQSKAEAEAAIESLLATGEWGDVTFRIREGSRVSLLLRGARVKS